MSQADNVNTNKISRRQMLRMTAVGAASLVVGGQLSSVAAGPVDAPSLQDTPTLRIQVNNAKDEQGIIDFFLSKVSNVKVEPLEVTGIDHEEVASKILSLIAAGTPPDIGYAATEALQLYAGKKLSSPLDERVTADATELAEYFSDVHPSLIEAMMYEGSLYELPRDFNIPNMYFNTGLLEANNLETPSPDWTKDDFYTYAKTITKKNANGDTDIFGYAWTNRLWGSWMPWIFVNDAHLLTEEKAPGGDWMWSKFYASDDAAKGRSGGYRWTTPTANSDGVVEALQFMVDLYKEGISPSIELGNGEQLQGFFTSGKLGMTPAGGHWSGGLHNAGMPKGSFDAQLFPKWKSQRHQLGTGGKWLAASSQQPDLGWQYLKIEISKEGMNANGIFTPVVLTTPSRRSMCDEARFAESGPANWSVFYDTLDKHPDTGPIPAPPQSNEITQAFVKYTGLAMTEELTAKDALDQLQDELVTIMSA